MALEDLEGAFELDVHLFRQRRLQGDYFRTYATASRRDGFSLAYADKTLLPSED